MSRTLHIINKSPFEHNCLATCLRLAKANSVIVLYEDGVYAALANTQHSPRVQQACAEHTLYAIKSDVDARGLSNKLLATIQLIDYAEFAELSIQCTRIQNWN